MIALPRGGNSADKYAPDRLTGRQKVAIVCMAIGTEHAAKVTAGLHPEEAEIVALEMAQLDRVPPSTVDAVLAEWLELTIGVDSLSAGGVEFAKDVLEAAFGPAKAQQILKRIQGQLADSDRFGRLRRADPQQLGNTLRGEHPQTIALILAHLDPTHVAAILRELDPALGGDVMFRIAKMEKVSPEMISLVERAIGSEADLAFSQGMSSVGGPAAVAAVLNLVSSSLEKEVLDLVAEKDAHLSDQIKNLMFVFEDLSSLDDKSLQRLLREVDVKQLALALKAASPELKAKIMQTMSQRAVAGLKEEMEFLGPVKMRDVEAAQTDIVSKVRALEETGEFERSETGEQDDAGRCHRLVNRGEHGVEQQACGLGGVGLERADLQRVDAAEREARARQAADQRVRARRRDAVPPRDHVPRDGADQRAEHHVLVDDARLDDALADGGRHLELEDEDRHHVEEGGKSHRVLRLEHAGGHHRGDRVGRVVEAVHEVECQGQRHQHDHHPEGGLRGLHRRPSFRNSRGRCPRSSWPRLRTCR